ncbi:MAG: DUF4011 domain-containing protein [Candidatus Eisenbacteria bacterium]|nr:DUF4011 domain-containing protein [Candidatus Eisenbacteria bacterium]
MTTTPGPAQADPVPELPQARRDAVDRARTEWKKRLIDTSRRNNLLYFRDLKVGTLDLTNVVPAAMEKFLQDETVAFKELLGRELDTSVGKSLREIRSRAMANFEERGLETLYLAMGMATWTAGDGGRDAEAAVLLVPARLEARGREGTLYSLARNGAIQVNLALLHVLETDYGVKLGADELLAELLGDDEGEVFDPAPLYARLAAAAAKTPGFLVKPRFVLGNFAYQKIAMVRDLDAFGDEMARHDLIAALAGDLGARTTLQSGRAPGDPGQLDRTPPEREFLVLDADSSQQNVIAQALGAQHGVVAGPPGTGKSQTIANLIAEFAANGKRVLFVAEKRAALDVVLRRLQDVGLGHLALDLHGADVSRAKIMEQLASSLESLRQAPPVDFAAQHEKFSARRARLLEYEQLLHAPKSPTGRSLYDMTGAVLALSHRVTTTTRWRGDALAALTPERVAPVRDALSELAGFDTLFLRTDASPWTGATLKTGEAVRTAIAAAATLARQWGALAAAFEAVRREAGFAEPATFDALEKQLAVLGEVADVLADYAGELFDDGVLESLVAALEPATGNAAARAWAYLANGAYRGALARVRALRSAGKQGAVECRADATSALALVARWRECAADGKRPRATPALASAREALAAFRATYGKLAAVVPLRGAEGWPLADFAQRVAALAADTRTPPRIPRLLELEQIVEDAGAGELVAELRETTPAGERFADCFDHAWLGSCVEEAYAAHTLLSGFHGRTHDQIAAEFRALDEERIRLARARVRRGHAERVVAVMNEFPEQEQVVRTEAARKRRIRPFRDLVRSAPNVLTAVRPCWMASPLSVSHMLPADRALFDIVLFDEASQVLPEDAIPSLLRANHAVVAGDRKQLPPTTFFAASDDEEEEDAETPDAVASATRGFESILDLMHGLLGDWYLEWHYRSRDESLIAFSNRNFYDDRLVTFPSPAHGHAMTHVHVPPVAPKDGDEKSSGDEVSRVIELILEHAEKRPGETLGVIALGITHSKRLQMALDEARRTRPELDGFFDESLPEKFFIKNLERVQGDERDAILLSVGYGKDRAGKLLYRFGPLLLEGGERRLNVAITRSRSRMTIVSSFTHLDMDPSRSSAVGVELLRRYLEYAASGGANLSDTGLSAFPSNVFERDVCDALKERGLHVLEQFGASKYRIDLVVQHPDQPGRFVLAIECDGASYHSGATARDRDRLRQQHLERLGWRFHRIWSTDWFTRRDEEVARAVAAYEAALHSGGQPAVAATAPVAAAAAAVAPAPVFPKRGPKPSVAPGQSIGDYTPNQLVSLARWIMSDGRVRTDEELFEELFAELAFSRRGSLISAGLEAAVREYRRRA